MDDEQKQQLINKSYTSEQLDILDKFIRVSSIEPTIVVEDLYTSNDPPLKAFTDFMNYELLDGNLDLDEDIQKIISKKPAIIRYKIFNEMLDDIMADNDIDSIDYKERIKSISRAIQVIDRPFHKTPIIAKSSLHDTNDLLDIYVLRKQTPEFIMRDITYHLFNKILTMFSSGLISFGVLCLKYENERVDVYSCNKPISDIPFMDIGRFQSTFEPEIQHFIIAILKKVFLDSLLRRRIDRPFTQYFTLDLYNRNKGQIGFHQDSSPELPDVNFFTLTYITNDHAKVFKGPTIISHTSTETEIKKQCNLVVGHGTTIGLDNRVLYHSTPNARINQEETILHTLLVESKQNHLMTSVATREKDHSLLNEPLLTLVEDNTANMTRLFFRTWYYDTPPNDITLTLITTIDLDKELYDEMDAQRNIQTTNYEDADILINDLLVTNTAFGMKNKKKTKTIIPFIIGNSISHIKYNKKSHTKRANRIVKKKKTKKNKKKFVKTNK